MLADYVTTVSRKYAEEIQTREYGAGLDGVVRDRADRVSGIINGVDYTVWSPEIDTFIAQTYSAHNLDGKKVCKKDLLQQFKLPADKPEYLERPLDGDRFAVRRPERFRPDRANRGRDDARKYFAGGAGDRPAGI